MHLEKKEEAKNIIASIAAYRLLFVFFALRLAILISPM